MMGLYQQKLCDVDIFMSTILSRVQKAVATKWIIWLQPVVSVPV
jgi:hypothetical protein